MSFLGSDDREALERPAPPAEGSLARMLGGSGTGPDAATDPKPADRAPTPTIGRLHKVAAEQLWGADPAQLVGWLRSNLEPLGEAIDAVLTPAPSSEVPGSANALLATERGGGPVIVVVQLGASSDEHFGVLLRQMVASTAKTAVWVSGEPGPEHLASVSWLNRAVDGRFYVVRVEAVRIADSVAAPVFTTVLRPPRVTDAVDRSPRPAGSGPDGQLGRRAEDWEESNSVEEAGA